MVSFYGAKFIGGDVTFDQAKLFGGGLSFGDIAGWSHPPVFDWKDVPPTGVDLPARGHRTGSVRTTTPLGSKDLALIEPSARGDATH
jgi:hypothetical protein